MNKCNIIVLIIGMMIGGLCFNNTKADTVGRLNYKDLKFTHIYSLTGSTPYVRFINKAAGQIWDINNAVLSLSPTWTDTDVALEDKMSTVGGWQVLIGQLPNGTYDMLIYDVSTAVGSRSSSDVILTGKHIVVFNGRIIEMSSI